MASPRFEQVGAGLWAVTNFGELWAAAQAEVECRPSVPSEEAGEVFIDAEIFADDSTDARREESRLGFTERKRRKKVR
jgi:hypothetical protein